MQLVVAALKIESLARKKNLKILHWRYCGCLTQREVGGKGGSGRGVGTQRKRSIEEFHYAETIS